MSKQRLSIGAVLMFISLGLGACHHAPFSASKIKAEAEAGDRGAQETLAAMYFIGDGVPVDREKQVFWLKKAAAQGSRYAYYRLGHNYEFGYGLAPDIFKAAEHYEIGSRLNSADAQTALARLLVSGALGKRDYQASHMWQKLSGRHGPMFAYRDFQAAKHLTKAQINRAEAEAKKVIAGF